MGQENHGSESSARLSVAALELDSDPKNPTIPIDDPLAGIDRNLLIYGRIS